MRHRAECEPGQLETLRHLPFVTGLRYRQLAPEPDRGYDAEIALRTHTGSFPLPAITKRSFFTRPAVNQALAWIAQLAASGAPGTIILARYVPRPVADRLIEAGVNFVDEAGNIHLTLGKRYSWTAIGSGLQLPKSGKRPTSAAQLQLLFQFISCPESVNWPVRTLEAAAGISKSKAAQARHELMDNGLLFRVGGQYRLGGQELLSERLLTGYTQILRPKILIGRFRPAERTTEAFLARLRAAPPTGIRYSLTGAPAADLLQHFYRSPDAPIFVQPASPVAAHALRLLPDSEGPVSLLRAFGGLVFGEQRKGHTLAPPWLIYAELLESGDPRAHEAAIEFRRQFLR